MLTDLKVSAVFCDYDGTLAFADSPIESSDVPDDLEEALVQISSMVPVAIVTAKDFHFIHPRTRFASAWACVGGLEIILADGTTLSEDTDKNVQAALEYVRDRNKFGLSLELKRSRAGKLLGFSIDWRNKSRPPERFMGEMITELTRRNLIVASDSSQPFFDVLVGNPNKGRAVRKLKGLLNVTGKLLYIGDSILDNSAFDEADVGICVMHNQVLENLRCRFVIEYDGLGEFLRLLARNKMMLDMDSLRMRER